MVLASHALADSDEMHGGDIGARAEVDRDRQEHRADVLPISDPDGTRAEAETPGRALPPIEDLVDDGPAALYLREIRQVPLLTADDEVNLAQVRDAGRDAARRLAEGELNQVRRAHLTQLLHEGDAAEQRLYEANLRLVVAVARRYVNHGLSFLDLIQEGNIGLGRGVARFDWRRGYRFSTYAYFWIRQAILRALAEQGRMIRLPVHVSDRLGKLHDAMRDLHAELGREPTSEEIGAHLGIQPQRVRDIVRAARPPISLEALVDSQVDLTFADLTADEDQPLPSEQVEQDLLADELEEALRTHLTPREVQVIHLRYGLRGARQRSLIETGDELGVSRERARQIETGALRKLRAAAPVLRLFHDYAS